MALIYMYNKVHQTNQNGRNSLKIKNINARLSLITQDREYRKIMRYLLIHVKL